MNETRIPHDSCNMILEEQLRRVRQANMNVEMINEIIDKMEEAEPGFSDLIREIAGKHTRIMKQRMNANPVKALESLCIKFAALAWDSTIRSLRMQDIKELERSFDDLPLFDDLEDETDHS